jgi:hypothetical protein
MKWADFFKDGRDGREQVRSFLGAVTRLTPCSSFGVLEEPPPEAVDALHELLDVLVKRVVNCKCGGEDR